MIDVSEGVLPSWLVPLSIRPYLSPVRQSERAGKSERVRTPFLTSWLNTKCTQYPGALSRFLWRELRSFGYKWYSFFVWLSCFCLISRCSLTGERQLFLERARSRFSGARLIIVSWNGVAKFSLAPVWYFFLPCSEAGFRWSLLQFQLISRIFFKIRRIAMIPAPFWAFWALFSPEKGEQGD